MEAVDCTGSRYENNTSTPLPLLSSLFLSFSLSLFLSFSPFFFLSFCLSWVANTQLNHWTKWVMRTNCVGPTRLFRPVADLVYGRPVCTTYTGIYARADIRGLYLRLRRKPQQLCPKTAQAERNADVTAKAIFERLVLVAAPHRFAPFVTMPSASTPPPLIL